MSRNCGGGTDNQEESDWKRCNRINNVMGGRITPCLRTVRQTVGMRLIGLCVGYNSEHILRNLHWVT